jgi:hypothetical protein
MAPLFELFHNSFVGRICRLESFWLRILCALACVSSSGALVLKMVGVLPMQTSVLYLFLPSLVLLAAVCVGAQTRQRRDVRDAIMVGAFAGLLATFAYDIARIPFLLAGVRVFITHDAYGIWIAEAELSSRFTHALGWAYHFSNGISFGVIYALFMRGEHWGLAVLYALMLETINLLTPFSAVFGISRNWLAIGILYLGHLAFGVVLGVIIQNFERWLAWLKASPIWQFASALVVGFGLLTIDTLLPASAALDARASAGVFKIEGHLLNPDFIRLVDGRRDVEIRNPDNKPVTVKTRPIERTVLVPSNSNLRLELPHEGIFQLFVETPGRTTSSFVIVEPAERTPSR